MDVVFPEKPDTSPLFCWQTSKWSWCDVVFHENDSMSIYFLKVSFSNLFRAEVKVSNGKILNFFFTLMFYKFRNQFIWRHPGFQNEPRQMFKNFVFKTAQTSSIADRLIFSARFSLIKHARHWFLGFYHVARHELLVLKSINISEYQSEAFSWNVLVFLRTVNFTLFLNLMFKW